MVARRTTSSQPLMVSRGLRGAEGGRGRKVRGVCQGKVAEGEVGWEVDMRGGEGKEQSWGLNLGKMKLLRWK